MVANRCKRLTCHRGIDVCPVVMEVERSAMVNEPGSSGPPHDVRVPGGAVDIADECIEPDGPGGEFGIHVVRRRVEVQRAFEVAVPDVESTAAPQNVLNLGVGLTPSERRVELDRGHVWHLELECLGETAHDDLRDQGSRTLARASELHDEQPPSRVSSTPGSEPPSRSATT